MEENYYQPQKRRKVQGRCGNCIECHPEYYNVDNYLWSIENCNICCREENDEDEDFMMQCVECGPVFLEENPKTCPKNHIFCEFCYENVYIPRSCSKCKREYLKENEGKKTTISLKNIYSNVGTDDYKFRLIQCEIFLHNNFRCNYVCPSSELIDHFQKFHSGNYGTVRHNEVFIISLNSLKEMPKSVHLIEYDYMLFLYKHLLDLNANMLYVMVQHIGPEKDANHFFYNFRIGNEKKAVNMMEMCHSDSVADTKIIEADKCVAISMQTLLAYIENDELTCKLTMSRI